MFDAFLARTTIAYFTMEIALAPDIPTYSGGLGMLAGDAARSAADLRLPMVFVSLVNRTGYLEQSIDAEGRQTERPQPWEPADRAVQLETRIQIEIEGRPVRVAAWLYTLNRSAGAVPVLLLDTDLPENTEPDRVITDRLYGGAQGDRLAQEIVLGLGGEAMLRALGFEIGVFHLNEGHAALLTLALLRRVPRRADGREDPTAQHQVAARCVFTTHTPVAAGHDRFAFDLAERLLGGAVDLETMRRFAGGDSLDMTALAMNLSGFINAVARRHAETAQRLYPNYRIHSVTNGVHPQSWVHPAFVPLYDSLGENWVLQPEMLVRAANLADPAIEAAHQTAKAELIALVQARTGHQFDAGLPILTFARRMTGYKRATLMLSDPDRLAELAQRLPFQLLFAGKAHPADGEGKELIHQLNEQAARLAGRVQVVFLPGYDFSIARTVVAGSDLWINNPLPPLEASGTSGMKAALNGVPSLSVLDGWWVEGCVEGVTGWAIGAEGAPPEHHAALALDALETAILPLYHHDRAGWTRVMKGAISQAGSVFTSHRMMQHYVTEAYLPALGRSRRALPPSG